MGSGHRQGGMGLTVRIIRRTAWLNKVNWYIAWHLLIHSFCPFANWMVDFNWLIFLDQITGLLPFVVVVLLLLLLLLFALFILKEGTIWKINSLAGWLGNL